MKMKETALGRNLIFKNILNNGAYQDFFYHKCKIRNLEGQMQNLNKD